MSFPVTGVLIVGGVIVRYWDGVAVATCKYNTLTHFVNSPSLLDALEEGRMCFLPIVVAPCFSPVIDLIAYVNQ